MNYLKKHWILLIIVAGLFLRIYKPLELFMYNHDQDLASWIIKDILVNKHLRLIGQETSSHGIFVGPLFYYLQIPFYLLSRMDPVGVLLLSAIFGVFSISSFYFVFSRIFNKNNGLITALIYSISIFIVFTDRSVVPTMPVMLWTVWYFYSLWLLLKGHQKAYLLLGLLLGLVWDLHLALAILSPLIIVAQVFSKKKISFKNIFAGVLIFTILMLPFFVFEARHNFQQTKSVIESFTSAKDYIPGTGRGLAKLDRVLQLVHKNTTNLYWGSVISVPVTFTFYLLILIFLFLVYKKILPINLAILMFLWQVLYILFFTINSINISEYYLDGMNVVWIGVLALGINYLFKERNLKYLGYGLLGLFIFLNLWSFFKKDINKSGYVERKAIVSYIDQDAKAHEYPCVSISYITSPGNNLGYRYFFWLKGMHVNQPKSGSPVYSIVFPHDLVNRIDKSFGALGLVLPDYERYNEKEVLYSCSGQNSNLTDPMFGFVK